MIKVLSVILLVTFLFVAFLLLGGYSVENSGYVLITKGNWKIEMTIVSASITAVAVSFIAWLLLKVTYTFFAMGHFSFKWFSEFGSRKNKKLSDDVVLALLGQDMETAKTINSEEIAKVAPQLMVATGLALRSFTPWHI